MSLKFYWSIFNSVLLSWSASFKVRWGIFFFPFCSLKQTEPTFFLIHLFHIMKTISFKIIDPSRFSYCPFLSISSIFGFKFPFYFLMIFKILIWSSAPIIHYWLFFPLSSFVSLDQIYQRFIHFINFFRKLLF